MLHAVSRYLHAVEATEDEAIDLTLNVATVVALADRSPEAAPLGTFDNGFTLWRAGETILLEGGGCRAHLNVGHGLGEVHITLDVRDTAACWVACAVVLECLSVMLHRHGLFSMHAAALARNGHGLVIAAAADSGKSTLTFRLVQSGWEYLSDDTILLRPTAERVEVLGMRAHFSLDPEAEELFPELSAGRAASLLKEEKWAVNVEALYPDQRVEACQPRVLLFPRIVDADESHLSQITNAEAMGALLEQSSLARVKLDHASFHVQTLGRLVGATQAFRLHAGRDLLNDPTRADALITPLLPANL